MLHDFSPKGEKKPGLRHMADTNYTNIPKSGG